MRPGATLEAGKPTSKLTISASAEFNEYARLQEYNGFQSSDIMDCWRFLPTHMLGPGGSQIYAGYSYAVNRNENPLDEDSSQQRADAGLSWRLAPKYRFDLSFSGTYNDYERTPQGTVGVRLAHLFNSHGELWLGVAAAATHTLSERPLLTDHSNYQSYTARVGFKKAFSPSFDTDGWVGATYVSGDESDNQAAGEASPTGELNLTYR